MTDVVEQRVAQHYTHGDLERTILAALVAAGKDPDSLEAADLSPVDEFHIGGRQATKEFAARLPFQPGEHLLDIGAGLGGASRYFAEAHGCRVTGIDLTEEYVATAEALARRVGLSDRVFYQRGSALDLPFAETIFDGAYMLHVGMNIEDKATLFHEVRRVLKPERRGFAGGTVVGPVATGSVFAIYDVMREGEGELTFPLPWAATPETSFVEGAAAYRRLLEDAGFTVVHERSRREFAIDFFQQLRARAAQSGGPPPLGLQILMGPTAPQKVANMLRTLEAGLIAPTEIIALAT